MWMVQQAQRRSHPAYFVPDRLTHLELQASTSHRFPIRRQRRQRPHAAIHSGRGLSIGCPPVRVAAARRSQQRGLRRCTRLPLSAGGATHHQRGLLRRIRLPLSAGCHFSALPHELSCWRRRGGPASVIARCNGIQQQQRISLQEWCQLVSQIVVVPGALVEMVGVSWSSASRATVPLLQRQVGQAALATESTFQTSGQHYTRRRDLRFFLPLLCSITQGVEKRVRMRARRLGCNSRSAQCSPCMGKIARGLAQSARGSGCSRTCGR